MTNQRVLITGANRGLGLELARLYVERGDAVWGTARASNPEALRRLDPAGVLQIDLGDEASVNLAIGELATQIDGLDLLINCAGIDARALGAPEEPRGPFDVSPEMFTEVTRINVTGPMMVTRACLPLLRAAVTAGGSPKIANLSSQLGSMQVAIDRGRDTPYCVSKAALNMLTVKTAAALSPEGITAIMLHPGWVQTDMGGSEAPLTPEESARALVNTISSIDHTDTGGFFNWDGTVHPW